MAVDIRKVKDLHGLVEYFAAKLDWNIDFDDFEDIEDITYDFDASDIGLKEEAFAKISALRQLPPLVDGQRWGIFSVKFDSKRFEVTALRKILSGLVPKRRNAADHAVWNQQDLLFLCFWGEGNERTIGVAHFADKEAGLPQIRMIYCAPAVEDFTQINRFEQRLSLLQWPDDPANEELWRETWSGAFRSAYRQTITDSSTLTIQLAYEAQDIRDRILDALDVEAPNGYVHTLYEKFKNTLIHDMTEQQFADMYAQTVVYGLFSARCMDTTQDDFSAAEAVDCIPNTNPFLKHLMQECLGARENSRLSFDELEIGDVVELLRHTQTEAIIEDFNRQTGGGREDPVIHFYEEFLTAYDKAQKVQRGVYYTPQPVVNFIVRAVDDILKVEFGVAEGLASTETKKIKIMRDSKKKLEGLIRKVEDSVDVPAVQVLDPSTGTGTFLRQVILQIYSNFKDMAKAGRVKIEDWSRYVDDHLLPRINGFELMMAPYAVAHMKLAMVLRDTGYDFSGDTRLNVYLTNTLEKPGTTDDQLALWDDPLATESVEANGVKKNDGINVVLGNPPYSGASANRGVWISNLLEDYKKEPGGEIKLQERNPKWINDDYVKFIRYAQMFIDKTDGGILAYICPHGFLNNPTFRGMRWQLLQSFNEIYYIDLHGNSNRKETCPDGSKDENVFDIQQGVCITIMVKNKKGTNASPCRVFEYNLYGTRDMKYHFLSGHRFAEIPFAEVTPEGPLYLFKGQDGDLRQQYESGIPIAKLFPLNGVGITTAHDDFVISTQKKLLIQRFTEFRDMPRDAERLYEHFNVRKKAGWDITEGWDNLQGTNDLSGMVLPISYRPFDNRFIFYEDKLVWRTVRKVMEHMIQDNIGFVSARSNKGADSSQFFLTENIMETKYGERTTQSAVFPLFVYESAFGKVEKKPNLDREIVSRVSGIIELPFIAEKMTVTNDCFDSYDLLFYLYAYCHSKNYRKKYHDFINMDFPVVPYPQSATQFFTMRDFGFRLQVLHLLKFAEPTVGRLEGYGDCGVERCAFSNNRVYINSNQYFSPVPTEAWEMLIGGYQPLQKWLKDRRGMKLSEEDATHYMKIVKALSETDTIMQEIDEYLLSLEE